MSETPNTVSLEELRATILAAMCDVAYYKDDAAKELLDAYREAAVKDAVMAERERCAKVCDELRSVPCDSMNRAKPDGLFLKLADNYDCARAIRTDPSGTVRGESE